MRWPFRRFGLIPLLLTSSLAPGLAWGAELPQPLTLQHAISLAASAEHPSLQQLQATTNQARIALEQIESRQGASVDLTGRLRWKRLQQQGDATLDDHLLTLSARKPLYDFGYSALESQIASAWIGQRQSEQQQQIESRKLLILENFFAVLLTDLQRTLDDETMTIAYLRFKKKEDKAPTGLYSELDLLQAESIFQDTRAQQKLSEMEQRLSRIRLAEVLNHTESIPSALTAPTTTPAEIVSRLAPVEEVQQSARADNRQLQHLQQQIEIARKEVKKEQRGDHPELDAVVEWRENSRVTSTKDRWRASLQFEWPLFDGGANQQRVALARESLTQAQSALEAEQRRVSEAVSRLHLQLHALEAKWEADQIAAEYRDFELDRNRALYEQEQQSNFGDALVGVSASHLRSAESRFSAILARAKLDHLMGKEIKINE